jgi:hypothetical protein
MKYVPKWTVFGTTCCHDMGMMLRRVAAIRECARLWREEQSRAIDVGDVARAKHAEKCALRFEDYLAEVMARTAPQTSAAGGSR